MFASVLPKKTPVLLWVIALLVMAGCTLPDPDEATADSEENIGGAPVIYIAAPLANSTYLEGIDVNIQVQVSNAGDDIARVEFFVDSVPIAALQSPNTANAPVFSLTQTWPARGIGAHTIAVTAFRNDGTTSDPASVRINVTVRTPQTSTDDIGIIPPATIDQPVPTIGPVIVPTSDNTASTAQPTGILATNTPGVPTAFFNRTMNVRSGPGLNFAPPIGSIPQGETMEILGTNLNETWLKVSFNAGVGWVYAPYVDVTGNLTALPHEIGPPTPYPTATPPPTVTPAPTAAAVNLTVVDHFVNPPVPQCGQDFTVGMTIRNESDVSTMTGLALIQDVHKASGTVNDSSGGGLVSITLGPRGQHQVALTLNVSTYVNEVHRIEFIADVNNEIVESNESDNRQAVEYTLPPCP
jgi:hypothetical protein